MDLTIISTYRCNSKCSMCNIWKYPSDPKEEISIETLRKLPDGFDNINITGGEPTLREDLEQICDVLYPKGRVLEISTNGLKWERLIPIVKKYPDIKIRFSLEGFEEVNDKIRGEKDGFKTKVEGLKRLKEIGGKDLGFGVVIQDDNIDELVDLYKFSRKMGVELATSTLHNAFQFHKGDNYFYNRKRVAKEIEKLITEQLRTNNIKNWFRAYLNLGLIEKILGQPRLIKCTAGKDFIFIDPWSDVYLCNVRNDLVVGNLKEQTWEEILANDKFKNHLKKVETCTQNCWMVTTARNAMRSSMHPSLPKLKVFKWVLINKIKVSLGKQICFEKYIDYDNIYKDANIVKREYYLDKNLKRKVTRAKDKHYIQFDEYYNK